MEAMTIVGFVVGCGVGGVIAGRIGGSRFQGARAAAEARVMAREAEVAGLRDGIVAKDRVIDDKVREGEAQRVAAEAARLEAGSLLERLGAEQKAPEETVGGLMAWEGSLTTRFQGLASESVDGKHGSLQVWGK